MATTHMFNSAHNIRHARKDVFTAAEIASMNPRQVANNTWRYEHGDETVFRLHTTDIVRVMPEYTSCILNSGGWRTSTTKDRMNRFMPAGYSIHADRGWHVRRHSDNKSVPFFDGIEVPQCFDQPLSAEAEDKIKQHAKLKRQIGKFVKLLDKGDLPLPSLGDCWYCSMVVDSPAEDAGKSLGDATDNTDHLLSHVEEGYMHGSLICNALKWCGYPNPGLILHMGLRDVIKRSVRKYLYRKLYIQ